jgi:geranylgeranyl pyrophosphate synthase
MNLYKEAFEPLLAHKISKSWPELEGLLSRAAARKLIAWKLPLLACQAVGATAKKALPAVSAFICIHISILLIDDLLDEDPRGEHHRIGVGRAANLAVALNSFAHSLLLEDGEDERARVASKALADMQLALSHGQDLDVQNQASEEAYWQVTHGKSAVYFGTAFLLGAIYADAKPVLADQLRRFGEIYGEIMQIHDDLNDCLDSPANPDWLQGRYPLPILFAEVVDHPERDRFIELRKEAEKPGSLAEAQAILVRCGAISYSVKELVERHAKASALINEMFLVDDSLLCTLLDEVIAPVERLFEKVGGDLKTLSSLD